MARRRYDFLAGALTAAASNADTTITSADFANIPAVTGSDVIVVTVDPDQVAGAPELIYITAHAASATTATVLRGQEGTTARSHANGTQWTHAPTVLDFEDQLVDDVTIHVVAGQHTLMDGAVSTAKIADHAVTTAKIADGAVGPLEIVEYFATSAARNAAIPSPIPGQKAVLTTTGQFLVYAGATDGWRQPWNLPWGVVNTATVTANQTAITTLADLTGLTVTQTLPANRNIRIQFMVTVQLTTASTADCFQVAILKDGVQIGRAIAQFPFGSRDTTITGVVFDSGPTAASHVYKLQGGRSGAGTGTYQISAGATTPSVIIVEDVGPNGSPS